jgi:hypothetical protein
MNGLCSACRQPVEVVDFRLDEGFVLVRCTGCGRQDRLSLSVSTGAGASASVAPPPAPSPAGAPQTEGPTSIEAAFEVPPGFCPKCVAPRAAGASSCPACGLVFATAVVDGTLKPSPPLADAWRALAARWTDGPEHVRFLRQAAAGEELAAAGHLYRIRLARAPEDAVARQSLEAAVKLASAPVSVAALRQDTAAAPSSRRAKAVAMAAVLLLAPTLMFVLLRLLGRR